MSKPKGRSCSTCENKGTTQCLTCEYSDYIFHPYYKEKRKTNINVNNKYKES